MKKLLSSVILGSVTLINYSSADFIDIDFSPITNWFSSLRRNFMDLFSPVTSFIIGTKNIVINIVGFIRDVLEFIGYGIATGLRYMWSIIDHLFTLSFWSDLFSVFKTLSAFLGVDTFYFAMMFFVAFILIIFSFLTRLIFGKLNFVDKNKR